MAQIDLKNCTFKIIDGTGTPNEITMIIGEGNLTFTTRRNIEYVLDRGQLLSGGVAKEGDEAPLELAFDFRWDDLMGEGSVVTPREALTQTNNASSWVSTESDGCQPYSVDISVENNNPCGTAADSDELYTFPKFRYEEIGGDMRAGTVSASGRCMAIHPTVVRTLFA